jgi:ArsR family transcriptional regulator, arsenate/arsenite/antimonite-responsive transcriptional repressor
VIADEPCCVLASALDEETATDAAGLLRALADPVRLRIISMIATAPEGEVCACDFPAVLERSQSTISHHLGQLVDAGLVHREQRGKWAWFRLDRDRLADARSLLGGSPDR